MPIILPKFLVIGTLFITIVLGGCSNGGIEGTPESAKTNTPNTNIVESGQVCAIDADKKKGKSVTPNLSQNLRSIYVNVESFGIGAKDLMESWNTEIDNTSNPAELMGKAAQVTQIGGVVTMTSMATAMNNLILMYACSADIDGGPNTCNDTAMSLLGAKVETERGAQNTYTRTVTFPDDGKGSKVMTIEGEFSNPGNITIRSTGDGTESTISTTRDPLSGRETYSITSSKDGTIEIVENKDCSGTYRYNGMVHDDTSIDIDMSWTLSGDKTSGTLTAQSSDPLLNTSRTW